MVAIIGIELGLREPLRRFAVLQPLYKSTIRSLMSSADPLLDHGGSSIAKGREDIAALSRKKAFVPLTYIAEDCEPVRNRNTEAVVYIFMYVVCSTSPVNERAALIAVVFPVSAGP